MQLKQVISVISVVLMLGPAAQASPSCKGLFKGATKVQALIKKTRGTYFSLLTPHGRFIDKNDPNGFVQDVKRTFDNKAVLEKDHDAALKGYNERREARLQRLSTHNGNSHVLSWYKAFEEPEKATYKTIAEVWYKKRGTESTEDHLFAIENIKLWVSDYKNLSTDITNITSRGFEAYERNTLLAKALKKYKSKYFAKPKVRKDGVSITLPYSRIESATGKISTEYRDVKFYRYDELVSAREDSRAEYESVFGILTSPVEIVRLKWSSKKPFNWGDKDHKIHLVLTPARLALHFVGSGLKGVKAIGGLAVGTTKWIASIAFRGDGQIQQRLIKQARDRRRLEMALHALLSRADRSEVELTLSEEELVKKINLALIEPGLAPTSNAIKNVQNEELSAERSLMYGINTEKQTETELPRLQRFSDVSKADKLMSVRGQLMGKVMQKFKKFGPSTLIIGAIATTSAANMGKIKEWAMDRTEVSVPITLMSDYVFQQRVKYLGYDGVLRSDSKASIRKYTLETSTMLGAVQKGTENFRQNFRENPENNFLQDPEFVKASDEIILNMLSNRESRGLSAELNYVIKRTHEFGYPTRTVTQLFLSLSKQYPDYAESIAQIKSQLVLDIKTNGVSKVDMAEYSKDIGPVSVKLPELLKRDLAYVFSFGYSKAYKHYALTGSLMNAQGSIYAQFAQAPEGFVALNKGQKIQFSPYMGPSNLFTITSRQYVMLKGAPSKDGFVEVDFAQENHFTSPTDQFFVHIKGLDK